MNKKIIPAEASFAYLGRLHMDSVARRCVMESGAVLTTIAGEAKHSCGLSTDFRRK